MMFALFGQVVCHRGRTPLAAIRFLDFCGFAASIGHDVAFGNDVSSRSHAFGGDPLPQFLRLRRIDRT